MWSENSQKWTRISYKNILVQTVVYYHTDRLTEYTSRSYARIINEYVGIEKREITGNFI